MKTTVLGEGVLGWDPMERRTNRYGAVYLFAKTPAECSYVDFSQVPTGRTGELAAVVLKFRYLNPGVQPPTAGQVIRLGYGEIFTELLSPGYWTVGVRPTDRRREYWLDFDALMTCHLQWVRLELRT